MEKLPSTSQPVNYKSDFSFILRLYDCNKNEVGFPEFDWRVRIYTPNQKVNGLTASCIGGVCTNCFNDNGKIRIVCNSHHLGLGWLQAEFTSLLPNGVFPDGDERIVTPAPLDIQLVSGAVCPPHMMEASLVLPVWAPAAMMAALPLPFQFCRRRTADHVDRDTVYFDRRRNLFVTADGDPAPEPYNETDAGDGTPRPSTSRRFVCCNRLYRHTGLQLVDTAIEALAGALPARRTPSINAHPGLAYLDRGIIRIPFHGGENRVSLKNMWYESIEINNQSVRHKNLVPLTECDIQIYDLDGIRAPYTVDGDNLIFTMPSMEYSDCTPACARVFLGVRYDGRIGVRYDGHGRKIFYRFCRHFSTPALPQPRRPFEFKIKIMRYPDRRCKFNISPTSGDHEIQVWLKRSYMAAGDDGQYIWVRRWQWRRVSRGVNVCMHTCLIRVRRKAGPLKSAWVYYHVDLRTGKIKPSRQQRM